MGRMRSFLWKSYYRWEGWILPGRRDPQLLYRDTLIEYLAGRDSWLDLGCGRALFTRSVTASAEAGELLR